MYRSGADEATSAYLQLRAVELAREGSGRGHLPCSRPHSIFGSSLNAETMNEIILSIGYDYRVALPLDSNCSMGGIKAIILIGGPQKGELS